MPLDIDAAVLQNTRLSDDYSVLALDAPAIAAAAQPGQFVMLKPSRGLDPLLRRPFSIFEILRHDNGTPRGISILNKRIGRGTTLLYDVEPGARVEVLGPLGRPFEPVEPPAEGWMVAGGVGLAPFVTLAEGLIARGAAATLFYGARRAQDLHCADIFERMGVRLVFATEDGSRGEKGFITAPLHAALAAVPGTREIRVYACGPTPMMRATAQVAASHARRCDVSLEQVMACGMGGCYSCVVPAREPGGVPHHTRSCIDGPVFAADRIVWEALASH
jgi:dihydroorotate dehydrogenase electron transfer subunit